MRSWLKKSCVKDMSSTEAAWLAGFIDGEGSISKFLGGRDYQYLTWRLSAPNTCYQSLLKCKKITGVGSVVVKKEKSAKRKKCWQWQVGAQREIRDVLKQIEPFLIIKRNKAKEFLRKFREV